jgi:hypothetical protein
MRYRCGGGLGSHRSVAGDKDIDPTIDQFGRKSRQLIVSALGPAKLDRDVAAFDEAGPS